MPQLQSIDSGPHQKKATEGLRMALASQHRKPYYIRPYIGTQRKGPLATC